MQRVYKISACGHCSEDAGCYCFSITPCIVYFYHKGINVQYLCWSSSSCMRFPTSTCLLLIIPTMPQICFELHKFCRESLFLLQTSPLACISLAPVYSILYIRLYILFMETPEYFYHFNLILP